MQATTNRIASIFIVLTASIVVNAQLPERPAGKVLDTTGTLSQQAIDSIAQISAQVNQAAEGDIMVAIVDTTHGRNPRQFATELFNHWQIGNRRRLNGVLVFAAMADRKAEIILGDGLGMPPEYPQAKAIMSDYMIPQFRNGNPELGIVLAVKESARRYFGIGEGATVPRPTSASKNITRKTHKRRRRPRGNGDELAKLVLAALGASGTIGIGYVSWRAYRRRKQRYCNSCQRPMALLTESEDNLHLTPGENVEEQLGSVDHDVWSCMDCDEVVKLRYPAWFSSYATCPQCRARTTSKTESIIKAATTATTGTSKVVEACQNCDYRITTMHTIPVVTIAASSNISGGSNFSGGSGFGGGGGFSGGSSSGGGASGSW